ncbi:MAG: universal stress protein [Legionella sp.]|uniref:universal stress protein n=1 Tax=Legionella sp. TaxID=459 RepID=UPI0039E4FBCE
MKRFHNILFVSSGIKDETEALKQALLIANESEASLSILIIGPQFPQSFNQYKRSYESFLKEHITKTIETAKRGIPAHQRKCAITIDIEWENAPSIRIIQHILRSAHDLLVKAAEDTKNTAGFKALDMALLRKCPCPLFLHRPLKHTKDIRIAAAIDTEHGGSTGQDLAISLLKLTQSLVNYYHSEFSVISCWDLILENFMRDSAWLKMSQSEIDTMLLEESNTHFLTLKKLIEKSEIKDKPTIYHLKGDPTEMIPITVHDKHIDMLVMGTVARTGISGFIIGNTAENILQQIDCSLWALKPIGFISPVKAY